MRKLSCFILILSGSMFLTSRAPADDLSDAYRKAEDLVRDLKPPSSERGEGQRDQREDSSAREGERERERIADEEAGARKRAREEESEAKRREQDRLALERAKEREHIAQNLEKLETTMAEARTGQLVAESTEASKGDDLAAVSRRLAEINGVISNDATSQVISRALALRHAVEVRGAIADGNPPPFGAFWDLYKYSRPIAYGLVGNEYRCAIVMSMTLGLQPGPDELSLQQIPNKPLVARVYNAVRMLGVDSRPIPQVRQATMSARYYVRAQQLADRLVQQIGAPTILKGQDATRALSGKRGIVFLEHAYFTAHGWTGNHIDAWDGQQSATDQRLPFARAHEVWFWEIK